MTSAVMIRPRLFYLVHRFPFPPNKGDRIRAFHIIRHLSSQYRLTVVTFRDSDTTEGDIDRLNSHCDHLVVVPRPGFRRVKAAYNLATGGAATTGAFYCSRFANAVRELARRETPDTVLISSSGLAGYLDLPELKGVPAVADLVDVDSQKWLEYMAESPPGLRWLYALEARRVRKVERRLMQTAMAVTLVTESEAELCRRVCGPGPIDVVTNGVALEAVPGPAAGLACVFIGAMDYKPNVEGAVWFSREVWPEVRRRHPKAIFRLVGRSPARAVRRLDGDGIEVVGTVADVRPYLHYAAISVSPLRIARGLQNKVLEAMAAARPVVASPGAAEGLAAIPGRDLLVAQSVEEWVGSVCSLLQNPAQRATLGNAGRLYVEQHHDWSECLAPLSRILGLGQCPAPEELCAATI